jgi:hypothetical protein
MGKYGQLIFDFTEYSVNNKKCAPRNFGNIPRFAMPCFLGFSERDKVLESDGDG